MVRCLVVDRSGKDVVVIVFYSQSSVVLASRASIIPVMYIVTALLSDMSDCGEMDWTLCRHFCPKWRHSISECKMSGVCSCNDVFPIFVKCKYSVFGLQGSDLYQGIGDVWGNDRGYVYRA